jgi:threonine/homoserine/homoserine lactone efflux protein
MLPLLYGLGLGLSLAGPPGPVNALIARESSLHGPLAGIRAGLPAPIVDTAYLSIVLLGASAFDLRAAQAPLALVGAVVLAYLAAATVRPAAQGRRLSGPWAVWLVTLTNPFQYAWWLSAGAAFLLHEGPWGIAGFLVAIFGWVAVFSHLVHRGATKWPWFTPALEVVSANLLVAYAARLALQGLQSAGL